MIWATYPPLSKENDRMIGLELGLVIFFKADLGLEDFQSPFPKKYSCDWIYWNTIVLSCGSLNFHFGEPVTYWKETKKSKLTGDSFVATFVRKMHTHLFLLCAILFCLLSLFYGLLGL